VVAPKKEYLLDISVEFNAGARSLISANESIFLKSQISRYSSFAIFEDDVYFTDEYNSNIAKLLKAVPSDWEILNLGYHVNTPINDKIKSCETPFYRVQSGEEIVGTHCLLYKASVIPTVLRELESNTDPWDWFLYKKIYPSHVTYTCKERLLLASSFRSEESDRDQSHKRYKSQIKFGV
jgi:GR25 family glycosyltransferase involved in LPS biosynthesis